MSGGIDVADLQGNILNGYRFPCATHLFLRAESGAGARELLGTLAGRVTTAQEWTPATTPRTTLNLSLTFSGFQRLGLDTALLARFPRAFREGPRRRAARLGDVGASDPRHWHEHLGTGRVHLLVSLASRSADDLAASRDELLGQLGRSDLQVVHEQPTELMAHQREHFGYADGFAQPEVEGVPRRTSRTAAGGGGVPRRGGGWRPLKLGEFVLGHADEDGQVATEPHPDLIGNGSYLVVRKLFQDVAGFRTALRAAAEPWGVPEEFVAAKVVGRWRDGVPLALRPSPTVAADLTHVADADPPNDFRYLPGDAAGMVCPRGAHVRRVNPRDSLNFGGLVKDSGVVTARHRMIRRGMPYGPPLPPGAPADDQDRGLLFMAYVADLERQFEFVQAAWCMDGDAFGLGADRDFLLDDGGGTGKLTVPGAAGPRFVDTRPDLVRTRGAEYLFTPGLRALRRLADGAFVS